MILKNFKESAILITYKEKGKEREREKTYFLENIEKYHAKN